MTEEQATVLIQLTYDIRMFAQAGFILAVIACGWAFLGHVFDRGRVMSHRDVSPRSRGGEGV